MAARLEVYTNEAGMYRFRSESGQWSDHHCQRQGCESKASRMNCIESVKRNAAEAPVVKSSHRVMHRSPTMHSQGLTAPPERDALGLRPTSVELLVLAAALAGVILASLTPSAHARGKAYYVLARSDGFTSCLAVKYRTKNLMLAAVAGFSRPGSGPPQRPRYRLFEVNDYGQYAQRGSKGLPLRVWFPKPGRAKLSYEQPWSVPRVSKQRWTATCRR